MTMIGSYSKLKSTSAVDVEKTYTSYVTDPERIVLILNGSQTCQNGEPLVSTMVWSRNLLLLYSKLPT